MKALSLSLGSGVLARVRRHLPARLDRVVGIVLAIFAVLLLIAPEQARMSARFLGDSLIGIAAVLLLSVALAAAAKATGAEVLIARAFAGRELRAILAAALAGSLSPLCSCGVVPLVAGLLASGVPLAPVMAFWLSSPVMDPAMFVLTAGTIGFEFAVAKTLAALFVGAAGGFITMTLARTALGGETLKDLAGGAAAAARLSNDDRPVHWQFWDEPSRAQTFLLSFAKNGWMLMRWMSLAFVLESLMLAYLPGDAVAAMLGENGWAAIPLAVLIGVPAYLNGVAAVPLVAGLIDMGMSPAVGLAFMVAGGVTSIPAAMAVWALVKPRVFGLYIALALMGALAAGYGYSAFKAIAA